MLLEEYPLEDLRAAVAAVDRAVRAHLASADRWGETDLSEDEEALRTVSVLRHDHGWFETSLEQLRGFLRVVERDDHGGHRQALGQYGRVLAESLRRHRRDERDLDGRGSRPDRDPIP